MAKRLNAETAGEAVKTPEQSKSNRRDTITNAIREIVTLTAQKKGLSDQIAEIKNVRIKGKLGMKVADFNAALRMYGLDQEARDLMLDTIRETFDALGIGEQLNWVTVAEKQADAAEAFH